MSRPQGLQHPAQPNAGQPGTEQPEAALPLVQQSAEQRVEQPARRPAGHRTGQLAEQLPGAPAEPLAGLPAEQLADQRADQQATRHAELLAAPSAEQPAEPSVERTAEDHAEQPSAQLAGTSPERETRGGGEGGAGDGETVRSSRTGAGRFSGELGSQNMSISVEPDESDPDLPGLQENSESEAGSDTVSEYDESEEDNEFAIAFRTIMQRSQLSSHTTMFVEETEQPAAQCAASRVLASCGP